MRRFSKLIIWPVMLALGLAACSGEASTTASQGSDSSGPPDPKVGQELFAARCAACHGPDGKGVPGLGKNMTTSDFIASKSDSELVAVIKTGIPAGQPPNDTAVPMPPKGGNPSLTDADLYNIVAYLRTIHQ